MKRTGRQVTESLKLSPEVKSALDKLKLVPREPYDSVILRLIKVFNSSRPKKN